MSEWSEVNYLEIFFLVLLYSVSLLFYFIAPSVRGVTICLMDILTDEEFVL